MEKARGCRPCAGYRPPAVLTASQKRSCKQAFLLHGIIPAGTFLQKSSELLRMETVLRLRQIGWALTPQQEQNFDSVCFKTALLRLSRKGGKLHHGNDHHCIRR